MRTYILSLILFLGGVVSIFGENDGESITTWDPEMETADTIIRRVIAVSPSYAQIIDEFEAGLYVRTEVTVNRVNHLIKAVPSMFHFRKGVKEYFVESYSDMHYTAPDIYDVKQKALVGTFGQNRNGGEIFGVSQFYRINPYSPSLLPDRLVSPLSADGMKRYYYLMDSIWDTREATKYKIRILPRFKSDQLMSGYMIVTHGSWTIDELYAAGRLDQLHFQVKVVMGEDVNSRYLPKRMDVDLTFKFVGNKLSAHYEATYDYRRISFNKNFILNHIRRDKYNLSDSYNFSTDSSRVVADTSFIAKFRPYPLTARQRSLCDEFLLRRDTIGKVTKRSGSQLWGQIGDALISNYTIHLADLGSLKCSPIINPLMIGYSHSNGYSYMQKFKYNYVFKDQKILRIVPRIGYNISRGEFYWRTDLNFLYWPEKQGEFHLRVGNGNRIYSSKVQDEVNALPDSLQSKIPEDLDYFRDRQVMFNHEIELINGLKLTAGVTYHHRTMVHQEQLQELPWLLKSGNGIAAKYTSFAPHLRLEWTCGTYYYMDGNHKRNLYSYFPTFSVDWERSFKGVMGSTGRYERLEFDMQQSFKLGAMRSLFYRIGSGAYTNQGDMHFVDYVNFARNSLPSGWNDEIGGTFQLLDHYWYNSSDKYARGNVTYEAPFLLSRYLSKITGVVQNERLYGGILLMPHILPYVEVGYGVGTHIFDFGIFCSSMKGKFETIGCKFTFELFNR